MDLEALWKRVQQIAVMKSLQFMLHAIIDGSWPSFQILQMQAEA